MLPLPNLPPSLSREIYADLCALLPPPAETAPAAIDDRNTHAMLCIADLQPADAFQAKLAAQIVATNAHASDALRLASQHRDDFAKTVRCRAQACAMMRQAQRVLAKLQELQKAAPGPRRLSLEATIAIAEPAPAEQVQPAPLQASAAAAQPAMPTLTSTPAATPQATAAPNPGEAPPTTAQQQAEAFARAYPRYAAAIQGARGVTRGMRRHAPAGLLPGDPAVITAIVHGTAPIRTAANAGPALSKAA